MGTCEETQEVFPLPNRNIDTCAISMINYDNSSDSSIESGKEDSSTGSYQILILTNRSNRKYNSRSSNKDNNGIS